MRPHTGQNILRRHLIFHSYCFVLFLLFVSGILIIHMLRVYVSNRNEHKSWRQDRGWNRHSWNWRGGKWNSTSWGHSHSPSSSGHTRDTWSSWASGQSQSHEQNVFNNTVPKGPDYLNYYGVLGLHPWCDTSAVMTSFRQVSLVCHPDKTLDMPEVVRRSLADMFGQICKAKEVLSQPSTRAEYDSACWGSVDNKPKNPEIAKTDVQLPKGWIQRVSRTSNQVYFCRPEVAHSQWTNPNVTMYEYNPSCACPLCKAKGSFK